MDDSVLPSKLLSTLTVASDIIRRHPFIHIYSHFDTDGLTAASIVAKALAREKKEFIVTIFEVLGETQMETIENDDEECIVVTDLGASYIKRFDEMKQDIVVLDHHTLSTDAERICYGNPLLYGISGTSGGCGASMAFLFAITLNKNNWDLAPLAVAGMVGDKQHIRGIDGLNKYIIDGAVKKKLIEVLPGTLIPSGQLSTELFMCTEPFIKGISGDRDGVTCLLQQAKIDGNKKFEDLRPDEREKLSSLLTLKLVGSGVTTDVLRECACVRFYLPGWGTDAGTLSSVINACGHNKMPSIGIAACLGDGKALEQAKEVDFSSRKEVLNAILQAAENINQMEHIQWIDTSESGFSGILCSIIMSYIGDPRKPTIAVNLGEDMAKVSSRGTTALIKRHLDLSAVMREACKSVGGEGGGHNIASGGSFPSDRCQEFLQAADRIVSEQLSG